MGKTQRQIEAKLRREFKELREKQTPTPRPPKSKKLRPTPDELLQRMKDGT